MEKQNNAVDIKTKTLAKEFANKYALSKTLRFELKPNKETKKFIEEELKNFANDKKIARNYKELKKLLDELHQEFIQDVMNEFNFEQKDLEELEEKYLTFLNFKDKDNFNKKQQFKTAYNKVGEKLAKKISSAFLNYKAEKYKNKFTLKNILDKSVLDILKEKYKDDEKKINIVKTFDGLFTYLTGFKQNRENFYKSEMKAGQFATRTIDNLVQFIKNRKVFNDKYKNNYQQVDITDNQIKIFELNYFNNLFLQTGVDEYNGILGNKKGEKNTTNDGINQKINIFKQKEKTRLKNESKKFNKSNYPLFKGLYKQVGSARKENDVYVEIFNDTQLVEKLNLFPNQIEKSIFETKRFYQVFFEKLKNNEFDLEKIYLPKTVGTYFSQLVFSDWSKLAWVYNKRWQNEKVKIKEGQEVNVQCRSLADVKVRLAEILSEDKLSFGKTYQKTLSLSGEINDIKTAWKVFWQIIEYHINAQFMGGNRTIFDKEKNITVDEEMLELQEIKEKYLQATELYKQKMVDNDEGLTDEQEKEVKEKIKVYLDRVKEIERIAHYFDLRKDFEDIDEAEKDSDFYYGSNNEIGYQELLDNIAEAKINAFYNEFRNYLTKINTSEEKIKLNFNSGSLLGGWDLNKETEKLGLIFRKKNELIGWRYYLGIINKEKDKKIFDKKKHLEIFTEESDLEKMEYKLMKDVQLTIPKSSTQLNAVKKHFKNNEDDFILTHSSSLGDFTKPLKISKEIFELNNFEYKKDYLEKVGEKKIEFDINNRVKADSSKTGQVKLFQKAFVDLSKEKEVYLKALHTWIDFCKNFLEVYPSSKFFDFSSLKKTEDYNSLDKFYEDADKLTYVIRFLGIDENYLNEKVANKELYLFEIHSKDWNLTKEGGIKKQSKKNLHTIYFEELFSDKNLKETVFKLSGEAEMFLREAIEKKKWKKKKDKTGKEILDKPRFTKNKIFFHIPIIINYGKSGVKQYQFNQEINQFISQNSTDIKIIGIDRGEKHLLYYSLINQNGKILESNSLNEVNGIDYHKKLDRAEKERQKARKSWQKIDQIKNLKAGYISQVIKKIVDLAIKNNAIIVLENLNFGFKSFRQKIEKNVYQQFEKALIDKLGFVVDKEQLNHRYAPQLSAPFESFEKINKQTGIVYYVLAANTSKVCPSCQWRKNIYPHYKGKNTIAEVLQKEYKMKMFWDNEKKRFKFEYKSKDDKDDVKVYSDVDRVRYDKKLNNNNGGYHIYNNNNSEQKEAERNIKEKSITDLLMELLQDKFEIKNLEGDLLIKMNEKSEEVTAEDIKDFIGLFNTVLNIRNSMTDTDEDYIQCPACGFDTRKENKLGIKNGDDNGAYNIALRGLYLLQGKKGIISEPEKPKLTFSNHDYFQWIKGAKN